LSLVVFLPDFFYFQFPPVQSTNSRNSKTNFFDRKRVEKFAKKAG